MNRSLAVFWQSRVLSWRLAVDVILRGACPRHGMNRAVDQCHQQCGGDSLAGDIAQHQGRPVLRNVKDVAEISTNLPGGDALRREIHVRAKSFPPKGADPPGPVERGRVRVRSAGPAGSRGNRTASRTSAAISVKEAETPTIRLRRRLAKDPETLSGRIATSTFQFKPTGGRSPARLGRNSASADAGSAADLRTTRVGGECRRCSAVRTDPPAVLEAVGSQSHRSERSNGHQDRAVRTLFLLRQARFARKGRGAACRAERVRWALVLQRRVAAHAIHDADPDDLLVPVLEKLLEDFANDFHVLCLCGANGADERVHLALRIALGLLHHQFPGDILVGADGLDQQHDAQGKAHSDQGLEEQKFLARAGHFRLAPTSIYVSDGGIMYRVGCFWEDFLPERRIQNPVVT